MERAWEKSRFFLHLSLGAAQGEGTSLDVPSAHGKMQGALLRGEKEEESFKCCS